MDFKELSQSEIEAKINERNDPVTQSVVAFYSSWWGGIVRDSRWLYLPLDDHQVHRGDAVFEAFRFTQGAFFDVDSHLDRLQRSAEAIQLRSSYSPESIKNCLKKLAKGHSTEELMVRLYLSRGPGGFTTDPRESLGPQLYLILQKFKPVPENLYHEGVQVGLSSQAIKPPPYHAIKSCNYLPNVLLKMEAIAHDLAFMIGVSPEGFLAESSTENILILTSQGELVAPSLSYVLKGTTLEIVLRLAEANKKDLGIKSVGYRDFSEKELSDVTEAAMVGTTQEVLPVGTLAGRPLRAPHVMKKLRSLLHGEMKNNKALRLALD